MNKSLVLLTFCIFLIISGCATTGPVRGANASGIIYTDAPMKVAFDVSCQALENVGYRIELKDQDKFIVRGFYHNPLTSYVGIYAQAEIMKEEVGTKILYGIQEPGGITELDITASYQRYANSVYKKISELLEAQGYRVQKK